jgi:tetratricopeptide (TPR) repeat protein
MANYNIHAPLSSANPEQVHAILEHGLRAQRQGELESARQAYLRALELAPDHPEALSLLGTVWLQLGDARQAASCLERAAHKLRNDPGVLGNLAQAYFALGRYAEAAEAFRKAGRLDPSNVYFQMGIANALGMQGKPADAETRLRRLADRFPDVALVWLNLGNAVRDQGRVAEAEELYRRAIRLDSDLVDARNNLASALHARKRFEEAESEYRACIALAPDYTLAQYNLASVIIDLGRFREAEEICRQIIWRTPEVAQAHTFLGAALGHQGRLREALECHARAAELAPQDTTVAEIYASALAEAGDSSGALQWFGRALALNPDSISAHQLLGNALLSQGCLADGWLEYGYRPAFGQFRHVHPNIPLVRTLAAQLNGHDLCVLREQGLGDELFFMRYGPQLSALGARITYYASNKLCSLFKRIACMERVLDETAPLPQAGTVILAGDLPHALSMRPACGFTTPAVTAPDAGRFLGARRISVFWPSVPPSLRITPLAEQLVTIRTRLAEAGRAPYLGVTWRGGIAPRDQRGAAWSLYKNIPIKPFAQALNAFPGTFIAFQRNPEPGEIEMFSRTIGKEVHDFSDLNENLEGMLAALSLADEYIGASNTNMHLRAAAGRTARVLVPCPAEWRWMAAGLSSPWFPGFSIYRQSLDADWSAALAGLHRDLENLYR